MAADRPPRPFLRAAGGVGAAADRDRISSMPIYEYVCMQCEAHFEELVRNGKQPDCPDCGAPNVRKQLSVFAAQGSSSEAGFGTGPSAAGGCCGGSCGCG